MAAENELDRIYRATRAVEFTTTQAYGIVGRVRFEKLKLAGKIRTRKTGTHRLSPVLCNAEDVLRYAREPRKQRI